MKEKDTKIDEQVKAKKHNRTAILFHLQQCKRRHIPDNTGREINCCKSIPGKDVWL